MGLIELDTARCTGDGGCVAECPLNLFVMGEDHHPHEVPGAAELCIVCGHCIAVCPDGALSLAGIKADDLAPIRQENRVSTEQADQFLKTRRSVRVYQETPIPHKELENCLGVARWAPSAANRQPVRWTVIETPEKLAQLADQVVEGLRTIPYFRRLVKDYEKGIDRVFRGAPHVVVAHAPKQGLDPVVDCTIALTYFELAAHARGLAACWSGLLMAAAKTNPAVAGFIELPEDHIIGGAMMVGYPRHHYHRIPTRHDLWVDYQ